MQALHQQDCQNQAPSALIPEDKICALLGQLEHWQLNNDKQHLEKTFSFTGYKQTTTFVNAVTEIAEQQDHHPDISFNYNQCSISYSTHSAGGLTMNDFICAARIDHLTL